MSYSPLITMERKHIDRPAHSHTAFLSVVGCSLEDVSVVWFFRVEDADEGFRFWVLGEVVFECLFNLRSKAINHLVLSMVRSSTHLRNSRFRGSLVFGCVPSLQRLRPRHQRILPEKRQLLFHQILYRFLIQLCKERSHHQGLTFQYRLTAISVSAPWVNARQSNRSENSSALCSASRASPSVKAKILRTPFATNPSLTITKFLMSLVLAAWL
jgi:hypothetical protein